MVGVVVLLGAPGSGKSAVGEELGRRGLRWRDWELTIVERWGLRDNFVAHKDEALPLLHDEMLEWIDGERPLAVIETTGLSDAPLSTDSFAIAKRSSCVSTCRRAKRSRASRGASRTDI